MDIEKILQQMTLEEKADFCSGSDFWHTQPVERLGVPAVMMSDGPSGLRKQDEQGDHLGINESIPAVCFPSSAAVSKLEATAALDGKQTAGMLSLMPRWSPCSSCLRRPLGPSLIITAGTPSRSTGCVCQKSEPEQKSAFSSSVICWMIFSISIL